MPVTVKDIIVDRLKQLSAEGLCGPECGCPIDDLGECSCGDSIMDCVPAVKHTVTAAEAAEYDCDPGETVYVPIEK